MADLTAKRTLVKSPPELWEELSEVERLANHLGAFGEIKITKLDPEHTVAWEGEHASGMVSIEPSGWGTTVTLTAELAAARGDGGATLETTVDADGTQAAATPETNTEAGGGEQAAGSEPATDLRAAEAAVDRGQTAASELAADPREILDATAGDTAGMERTPRELSPEADEHPRRRGLWSRLVRWLQGDEEGRLPASEPYQAPSVQPTLEALIPATPVPEAPTAEPAVEKPDDDVPAAALGPAEDDVTTELHAHDPAAELPADDAATDCPADEPAPEAHGTGSEPEATGATEEPGAVDAEHAQSVLERTLDTLGSAHHRPFSRG